MARSRIDNRAVIRIAELEQMISITVGEITPDISKPDVRGPLEFREACNKLIHGLSIELTGHSEQSEYPVLSERVTVIGESHRRKETCQWMADLRIPEFLRVATRL